MGAASGRVRGRARIVRDPASATIEPGEILIAPTTDPGWTPLFLTAGGLVTETGAVMAHGPTVAREYGIPSVICVPGATERIRSGQLVSVDGAAGTVTIEQPTWTVRRMPMSGATSGHRSRLLRPSSPRGLRVTDLGRGKRHDRRVPQRRIAQDVAVDELLARDPLALLIGMLDQHRTATASG